MMQARSPLPIPRQTTFRDICYRLRLDQSEIIPIPQSKRTWQTCCVCASVGQFGISGLKECPAKVSTQTKTAKWNDRYLCEKHLEAVSKALRLNIEQPPSKPALVVEQSLTYPNAILTVLGKVSGWLSFDDLAQLTMLYRKDVARPSLRQACCELRDAGRIEIRRNDRKTEYRLIDEPQS